MFFDLTKRNKCYFGGEVSTPSRILKSKLEPIFEGQNGLDLDMLKKSKKKSSCFPSRKNLIEKNCYGSTGWILSI